MYFSIGEFIEKYIVMILNRFVGGPILDPRLNKIYLVNNYEYSTCNFMCKYCFLGRISKDTCPYNGYRAKRIVQQVDEYISKYGMRSVKGIIISPIGEPTLDPELPNIIKYLKMYGLPVGVYTNSSRIFNNRVYNLLKNLDIVVFKLDTLRKDVFDELNRPIDSINPYDIYKKLVEFRRDYRGKMYLDIMLVNGYNDDTEDLDEYIEAVRTINPNKIFITIPYYPNGYGVKPASIEKITYLYSKLVKFMPNRVEIIDYKNDHHVNRKVEDPVEEFIYLSTINPMTLEDAYRFFSRFDLDPKSTLEELIELGDVDIVEWLDKKYVISHILTMKIGIKK